MHCISEDEYEIVVYGEGCYQCFVSYVSELTELAENGNSSLRVEYLDSNYLAKNELNLLYEELKVPSEYRGSVVVSVEERLLFINYVPMASISKFLESEASTKSKYTVYWSELEEVYTVIDENGDVYRCENDSFTDCGEPVDTGKQSTLLIVLLSGLLDGVNPCAFTVLVFMITILFTIQSIDEKKSNLALKVGLVYIVAVYIGYLVIGLALFQLVTISGAQKLFAQFGALLLILLGISNVRDSFKEGKPALSIPDWAWVIIKKNIRKASIPAAFLAGLLVSIVEFPCTGGVYLSIMGMIASEVSYSLGLIYLVLYNVAFVFPLIIVMGILLFLKSESFSFSVWRKNEKRLRLFSGLFFIGLALYMLLLVL